MFFGLHILHKDSGGKSPADFDCSNILIYGLFKHPIRAIPAYVICFSKQLKEDLGIIIRAAILGKKYIKEIHINFMSSASRLEKKAVKLEAKKQKLSMSKADIVAQKIQAKAAKKELKATKKANRQGASKLSSVGLVLINAAGSASGAMAYTAYQAGNIHTAVISGAGVLSSMVASPLVHHFSSKKKSAAPVENAPASEPVSQAAPSISAEDVHSIVGDHLSGVRSDIQNLSDRLDQVVIAQNKNVANAPAQEVPKVEVVQTASKPSASVSRIR